MLKHICKAINATTRLVVGNLDTTLTERTVQLDNIMADRHDMKKNGKLTQAQHAELVLRIDAAMRRTARPLTATTAMEVAEEADVEESTDVVFDNLISAMSGQTPEEVRAEHDAAMQELVAEKAKNLPAQMEEATSHVVAYMVTFQQEVSKRIKPTTKKAVKEQIANAVKEELAPQAEKARDLALEFFSNSIRCNTAVAEAQQLIRRINEAKTAHGAICIIEKEMKNAK